MSTLYFTVFIDGTKIESAAGCYTFCWRKNSEKQLAKVKKYEKDLEIMGKPGIVTQKQIKMQLLCE